MYNEVVKRLVTNAYDWEPLSEEDIQDFEEGLKDYVDGKFHTLEEIEEEIEKKMWKHVCQKIYYC
jgi:hypothetical protein